jgi:hypothetical protein
VPERHGTNSAEENCVARTHHQGEHKQPAAGIIDTEELQARLRQLADETRQLKEEIRNLFSDPPERSRWRRSNDRNRE